MPKFEVDLFVAGVLFGWFGFINVSIFVLKDLKL